MDDPDLGADALEDDVVGGGNVAGSSEEGGCVETWPDYDDEEDKPHPARGAVNTGAGPSAGSPGSRGRKKRKHNSSSGAGSSSGGGVPALGHHGAGSRPPAPTTVAGTFQGILGARPPAPATHHALQATSSPAPSPQWDQAALIAALHQMSVQPPSTLGGDWVFDSGASSHMSSGAGIPFSSPTPSSPSSIVVGDGSTLPIVGLGSASLNTPYRSISLLKFSSLPPLSKT